MLHRQLGNKDKTSVLDQQVVFCLSSCLVTWKGAISIGQSNKKDKCEIPWAYVLSLPGYWSSSYFLQHPLNVEEWSCCQMHRVVIRTVKSAKSLIYWCCDCSFRGSTEQSYGLHVHVHLDLWLNKYCLWCDQLLSKPELLQAHDWHRKSQDFPRWICNSLSGCLKDSTTSIQHLIKNTSFKNLSLLAVFQCWGFFPAL